MKIAFILPSLANKGPIVFTKYLIEGLIGKVDYIEVFYFNNIIELDLGVPTKQISFFEKIDFDNFDIVHSHMIKADLYSFYWSKLVRFKWILTIHNFIKEDLYDLYPFYKALLFEKIWKIIFSNNKNLIMSSSQIKTYYNDYLNNNIDYKIITYGIPKYKASKVEDLLLEKLKSKFIVIGSAGSLIDRKGFKQLVNFLENNNNYAVAIFGEGPQKKSLLNLANQKGLTERFFLLGFKHNSTDYYKYFDIYAMTSYSEGFGLAMLEAMSQSVPIICSNLEIYQDYFSDADVGLFEPDNTKSLENAILKVSKDIDYYKIKSYELYENKFSLEAMGNNHIEYYKEIINK